MFIAVEGPDGAGKTTLVERLRAHLRAEGREVVMVREPGGTPVAEAVRSVFLDPALSVGPASELFLILAARSDLVRTVIRPALAAGAFVLADRYSLSTIAYQAHGRGLPEDEVMRANALATDGVHPGLTLVLDLDRDAARDRRAATGLALDRMELAEDEFQACVTRAFREATGTGIVHLDARGTREEVARAAVEALHEAMSGATP